MVLEIVAVNTRACIWELQCQNGCWKICVAVSGKEVTVPQADE